MNIKTQIGWAGFLMVLSAFNLPVNAAAIAPLSSLTSTTQTQTSIESRLTRIAATLKANESQLPEASNTPLSNDVAAAWANGNGRGAFVNSRRGWRNGGFNNNNWRNGGSFLNRR